VRLIRLGLVLFVCFVAQGQRLPGSRAVRTDPLWRRNFIGFLGQPAANLGLRDIERFENYLLYAAPYCGMLAAAEIEANRDLARNMTTYLATVNTVACRWPDPGGGPARLPLHRRFPLRVLDRPAGAPSLRSAGARCKIRLSRSRRRPLKVSPPPTRKSGAT
jgi:hypothetical protein